MISLIVGIALSGLIAMIIAAVDRNNRSGLKRIPAAHFTSPFSKLWLLSVRWRSTENRTRSDLHRRLGPVVRIGPQEVSVDGVDEGLHLIYTSKFSKDDWWRRVFFSGEQDILVTMKSHEEHKTRRKMLAKVYSKSNILNSVLLEESLTQVMRRLKIQIDSWASSGHPIEFKGWMKASIMDIATGWCYGIDHSTDLLQDNAARKHLSGLIDGSWVPLFWRCEAPRLAAILGVLGINVIPKTSVTAGEKLKQWSKELTAKASSGRKSRSAATANVYDHLHDSLTNADPDLASAHIDTIIAPELNDHVIASYELCSIALIYAMYELSRSPKIQLALRRELGTLATSKGDERSLAQRIDELPLLEDILTETLRVHPPGIGPWPRIVPEGGCRLAGRYDIPGGTTVSASAWTIHGNADVFPSPSEWRPERWSEADPSRKQEMRKWFWAFGNGARMCVAIHFAVRVLKKMLVTIYTDYETIIDENFTGSMEQIDALLGLPISNSLYVKFRKV